MHKKSKASFPFLDKIERVSLSGETQTGARQKRYNKPAVDGGPTERRGTAADWEVMGSGAAASKPRDIQKRKKRKGGIHQCR